MTQAVIAKADLSPEVKPLTQLHVAPVIQGASLVGVIHEGALIVSLHGVTKVIPSRLIV